MKRIGILGGTFNPIHIGHLTIAQMAYEQIKLDSVIFVPSYLPPHKSAGAMASAKDRCQMIRLAIRGNPCFEISEFETQKKGKSYSIDTVSYFRDYHARGTKFFFIIGCDHLPALHAWKRIDDLSKMVTFVAVNRPGSKRIKPVVKVTFMVAPNLEISSSDIRSRVKAKKTVKYLVPEPTLKYIEDKKLYR